MNATPSENAASGSFIGRTLDVALDPTELDAFIDAWIAAGLETGIGEHNVEDIEVLGPHYYEHLKRAELFLQRGEPSRPKIEKFLESFDGLAAFIVDHRMQVVTSNAGAGELLGLRLGDPIDNIELNDESREALKGVLRKAVTDPEVFKEVLSIDGEGEQGPTLFQIRRLSETDDVNGPTALVVTSRRYWHAGQEAAVRQVFGLTLAESEVVGEIVKGLSVKSIAQTRGTSEGTVRDQVKKIFLKMDVKSQSEIIRLALPLSEMRTLSATNALTAPGLESSNWLERDWSEKLMATRNTPLRILLGEEDPTVNPASVPQIREAYPWIDLSVIKGTGKHCCSKNTKT